MKRIVSLFVLSIFWPASAILADETVKVGDEVQINTFTTADQGAPEVAVNSEGEFIVVWESDGAPDGSSWGVRGQRLAADGTPLGMEFPVNTYTADLQVQPFVAVDGQDNFVVVWQSYLQGGEAFDIFGQRFDSSGSAIDTEFQVNTYTENYQGHPTVAADDVGNFLVVWESNTQDLSLGGIYGQLYDSSGNAVGGEFQINTTTAGDQNDPRVVATDSGFLVAWESDMFDGSNEGVVMQFLDSNAVPVGGELQVNTHTSGDQEDPAIAIMDDGTFAVVWESQGQDGSQEGVFGQVFDPTGLPIGPEFQLNTYTPSRQDDPSVAPDGTGGFIATWGSRGQIGDPMFFDIFGQRFDTAGQLVGGEFQINKQASYDQDYSAVAGGVEGRFLVVWHSGFDFDGDGYGVFGQRFDNAFFADGFESGNTSAWSATVP